MILFHEFYQDVIRKVRDFRSGATAMNINRLINKKKKNETCASFNIHCAFFLYKNNHYEKLVCSRKVFT